MSRPAFVILVLGLLAPAAACATDTPTRGIGVSGEGEVRIAPDRARLVLGVERSDPELRTAEAAVNTVVRDFLAEAKKLGAPDRAISTTGVQIQPEYVWPKPGAERRLTGYRVHRQIELTVENLDRLGDFLLAATRAGINHVSPPQLEHSRATELEQDALAAAARHAQSRARRLAETLGARLGPVRRIDAVSHESSPVPLRTMTMRAAEMDGGGAEMGLATGEIVIRRTVRAEFELRSP
jgi:uncharacterized protein